MCRETGLVRRVNTLDEESKTKFILENKDMFEGAGRFKGEYNIKLKEGSVLVVRPPFK